jgi:transcriptional regulator with PAS, ATPase and Fis domain
MPRKPSLARTLVKSLDAAAAPVYLLDGARRIVYANAALGQWIGRSPEDLAGVRCDYHASPEVSGAIEIAAGLCPPPEAFTGEMAAGTVAAFRPPGPAQVRHAQFVRLASGEDAGSLLVVVGQSTETTAAKPADAAALSPDRLHALLQQLRSQAGKRYHTGQLIGQSAAIRRVREQVRVASQSGARTLIAGPPGSGREHVARTIHVARGLTSVGPLVPIACAVIDAEELQATLTSLVRHQADSPADKPPVALLLEVDRLHADAQAELAGFLDLPKIELRTLATSRISLARLAAKGRFHRELALALSTLSIALSPLASRPEDIPLVAQHFLEEFNAAGHRQLSGFAAAAMDELVAYSWPGNVAELADLVRQACQRTVGLLVQSGELPDRIRHAANALAHPVEADEPIRLDEFLAEIERELIQRALKVARNNKTRAAELLGVNRPRLLRRLVQLGLAPPGLADAAAEEAVVFEAVPDEPSPK